MEMKTTFAALVAAACTLALAAAEPFVWKTSVSDTGLALELEVAPGYYVYADTLSLQLSGRDGGPLALAASPPTEMKKEGAFGTTRVLPAGRSIWLYRGAPPFRAVVTFNGCREGGKDEPGLCLPPETLQLLPDRAEAERIAARIAQLELDKLPFELRGKLVGTADEAGFLAFLHGGAGTAPEPNEASALWVIVAAVLGGILLNLTPCVLPMIPVNLAIIQASGSGAWRGFRRGGCYALGMAAAYGGIGAAVVAGGAKFGDLNSSAIFNFVIAGVFLILAAATAGFFDLDLNRIKRRPGYLSALPELAAFLTGALAALLAGACVAPVVLTVLIFAVERYQAGNPAALLVPLALGVGMGLPWPFAGMGLAVLPKPGKFMVYVKYGFAVLILALAGYYAKLGFGLLPGKFSPEKEFAKLETALVRATDERKPVLIDLYATWCKNCRKMDEVLAAPEVKKALGDFVVVKFQAEDLSDARIRELLRHWDIPGLPAFVILDLKR